MVASPNKQLALDANLLLDLAGGRDFAEEFREEFQMRGFALVVPPTVIAELALLASLGTNLQRSCANIALETMRDWKCQPIALSSTELAIALEFSRRLLVLRLIPDTEQNDGKILAQASLARVPLLVTSDKHLLDIDDDALSLAFQEADLWPVHPVHPKRLLKALH
jgi:hypothetical protein